MENQKGELEEINFQIFRIKYAIKQYRERCEILGINPTKSKNRRAARTAYKINKKERSVTEILNKSSLIERDKLGIIWKNY